MVLGSTFLPVSSPPIELSLIPLQESFSEHLGFTGGIVQG